MNNTIIKNSIEQSKWVKPEMQVISISDSTLGGVGPNSDATPGTALAAS